LKTFQDVTGERCARMERRRGRKVKVEAKEKTKESLRGIFEMF
jgi:hypothetical protein